MSVYRVSLVAFPPGVSRGKNARSCVRAEECVEKRRNREVKEKDALVVISVGVRASEPARDADDRLSLAGERP